MSPGRLPLNGESPGFYQAPENERGRIGIRLGRLLTNEIPDMPEDGLPDALPEFDMQSDSDRVTRAAEDFLRELHDTDRYSAHIDRTLQSQRRYSARKGTGEDDLAAMEIIRMSIALHDMVDHAILQPEVTASKLGRKAGAAEDISNEAVEIYNNLLKEVEDEDGLAIATLFAIDASKWESTARMWRQGANARIDEMVKAGALQDYSAKILTAAINKDTAYLNDVGQNELTRVLKENVLLDLKLGAISEGTRNHNVQGLFLKGVETLDIIENPPPDNPASTWRDCTEALNFFVPALATLGYRELAMDLRGAALKWLHDDPFGDAEKQHTLAARYFDDIKDIVCNAHEERFEHIGITIPERVKTEGSIRAKLAKKEYVGLHQVPDGIGFSFVVPDGMTMVTMERFARDYQQEIINGFQQVIAKHPNENEPSFETKKRSEADGGYKAIHMTFYYYPADGRGEGVPFEIQVLTETQYRMKLYGRSSDLFYKAGTGPLPDDEQYLDRLAKRGQAEREMAPGSTIQSISEAVASSPRLKFIFNELFRAVDMDGEQRLLVPPELEEVAHQLSDNMTPVFGESLAVLPSTRLSETQFKRALSIFSRDLLRDANIAGALALIKETEAGKFREDGVTPVLEGHILPTALSALMLAIQSGQSWESEKHRPSEYMSNIVTIAILHDHVEALLENCETVGEILQIRKTSLKAIRQQFGLEIMQGVKALTVPLEIMDEQERRDQYTKNVQTNGYARLIKPADRWQNHITDLVELSRMTAGPGQEQIAPDVYKRAMQYFAKTDRHLSKHFTSPELPDLYPRVHEIIWHFARHFGYEG